MDAALRPEWILVVFVLVQPGCFLSGSRNGDDRPPDSPRILRPGFSTVPLSKEPDGRKLQGKQEEDEKSGKEGENGRTGEGEKGTQRDESLPPPAIGPPPVNVALTAQSRSLPSPPPLNPPLGGPLDTPLGPGKLPALDGAPLGGPPVQVSVDSLPNENRFGASSRDPLGIALKFLLEDKNEEFLDQLKQYDPARQNLFKRVLPTLPLFSQKKITDLSPDEASRITEVYQFVVREVRPRTPLIVENACFCDWVNSFGVYQPCTEGHVFQASSSPRPGERLQLGERVQLYVEVRNFASVQRDGFYETRLASTVEIAEVKNGQKKTIWSHAFNEKLHRSRSPRNDHFNNYSFNVPPMPPGEYILTIHIADETIPEARRETSSRPLLFRVGTRQ